MALISTIMMTIRGRCLRRVAGFVFLASAFLVSWGVQVSVKSAPTAEYQVKAVFLFNFAQFVEWPPAAFPDRQGPMVIGVLGQDPFGNYLDETVRGEKVNNRALVVRRYRRVEDIQTCHVLFISRSEAARLDSILASLRNRKILTVADFEGASNVMIRLVTQQNKIRLRINSEAARTANLTISSKLLRLGGA